MIQFSRPATSSSREEYGALHSGATRARNLSQNLRSRGLDDLTNIYDLHVDPCGYYDDEDFTANP